MPSFDDTAFRAEVRLFLHEHLPADMARRGRTDVHPTRADMLGITVETASRALSQFRKDGVIRSGRRWIAIVDRDRPRWQAWLDDFAGS